METSRKTPTEPAAMSSTMTQLASNSFQNKPNRQAEQINHSTHSVPLTQNMANMDQRLAVSLGMRRLKKFRHFYACSVREA